MQIYTSICIKYQVYIHTCGIAIYVGGICINTYLPYSNKHG